MSVKYEAQAEYGGSEYDFDINRVTLSLHRIIEQNSNESGLLVPCWNFYGKTNDCIRQVGAPRERLIRLARAF